MLNIEAINRKKGDSPHKLAKEERIPAVFYGPKQASTSVSISIIDFKKLWKKAGESTVVTLKHDKEEHDALIHDVDWHPVTDEPRHVDFYVIEKGKKVQVAIPLSFDGVSPAVKDKAGILVKVLRELEIEASPKDLPHSVSVDISKLIELSDTILAKDIVLPKGVDLKIDPNEVIASVSLAKEEKEEAPTAIDMSAIEVEKKGKEEPAEGEAGATDAPKKEDKKAEKK